jgi:hypothetical protein
MRFAARTASVVLVLALAAGVSGCASAGSGAGGGATASPAVRAAGSPASGGASSPAARTAAIPALARRLTCPSRSPVASPVAGSRVPAGFRAAAVVECISLSGQAPESGSQAGYRKFVAVAGLDGLVAAVRSVQAGPATGQLCLSRPDLPWFVLISRSGQVLRPALLDLRCGARPDRLQTTLAALPWISLGLARIPAGTQ